LLISKTFGIQQQQHQQQKHHQQKHQQQQKHHYHKEAHSHRGAHSHIHVETGAHTEVRAHRDMSISVFYEVATVTPLIRRPAATNLIILDGVEDVKEVVSFGRLYMVWTHQNLQ
jgi:hypothetical protein